MKNNVVKKCVSIIVSFAIFSALSVPAFAATVTDNQIKAYWLDEFMETPTDDFDVIYFTDDDLFDLLESYGVEVNRPEFSGIQPFKVGVNKIVRTSDNSWDIYLSSTVLKTIKGAGVVSTVLLNAIPTIGPFLSVLAAYLISENIDSSCGWIFHIKTKVIQKGEEWGYKQYVASKTKQ